MKENIEEDTMKKFENPQNIDLITLIRQFKREGIENFIVLRKNDFDEFLSDYKRVLKENEELKQKYDVFVKMSSDVIANSIPTQKVKDKIEELNKKIASEKNEKVILWLHKQRNILQDLLEEKGE